VLSTPTGAAANLTEEVTGMLNRTRLILASAVLLLAGMGVASAASYGAARLPHYPRGHAKSCVHGYAGHTWRHIVRFDVHRRVIVVVRVDGHPRKEIRVVLRRVARVERFVMCVAIAPKKVVVPPRRGLVAPKSSSSSTTTTTTTTLPAPSVLPDFFSGGGGGGGVVSPPSSSPPLPIVTASVDPSYTMVTTTPQAPPVQVSFAYSAAVSSGSLPDGTLTLNIYTHGSVSSAGGCAVNVTPQSASSACTVSIPAWGEYDLVTNYSGGSGVAAVVGTETVDVQPPALVPETNVEAWTPAGASLAFTGPSAATVTATSPSFEGASSVALTATAGTTPVGSCDAPVSGTSAACSLSFGGTPTGLSIAYPGGTTSTVTATASPWGVAEPVQITTTWPAEVLSAVPQITKAPQTVSFTSAAPPNPQIGDTYAPGITSTSDGPITLSTTGGCTASGQVVTFTTGGTCAITATQPGDSVFASASATQSLYVRTVANVVDTISAVDAFIGFSSTYPAPCNPGNYECLQMGIQGTMPNQGTVTLTASVPLANGTTVTPSCTIDLATAQSCHAQWPYNPTVPGDDYAGTGWSVTASWSGWSFTDANGNVTNYSAPTVTVPMLGDSNSGSWWAYQGT
jgi:hypothetical protein